MAYELLGQNDFKSAIDAILRKLLEFFGGDRAYVFEFDLDRALMNNTYELCAGTWTLNPCSFFGIGLHNFIYIILIR